MEMKKDNRTEFEKMEAGEMFWNSDEKIGELKKHARRLADRFTATTEDEPKLRPLKFKFDRPHASSQRLHPSEVRSGTDRGQL